MEKDNIKISVVMPVYNKEPYLRECLNSIVNQTLKDIEIICIDDASTDESYELLKEFSKKDSRFVILQNPHNLGAAPTRNIGINLARGEYVSILDSDDYFEHNMLDIMYKKCKDASADMAICNIYWRDESTKKESEYGYLSNDIKTLLQPYFNVYKIPDRIFTLFLEVPFNKLYRRNFLLNEDLMFQNIKNSNDVYFGQMSMVLAGKIVHVDEYFCHYRFNTPKQISSNRSRYPLCNYLAYEKIYHKLKQCNMYDVVRKSFFDVVVYGMNHSLRVSFGETHNKVLKFWQSKGMPKFEMENLNRNDFCNYGAYVDYKKIVEKKNVNVSVNDEVIALLGVEKYDNIEAHYERWGWSPIKKEEKGYDNKYVFPYHLFYRNCRLVIYGIGNVGKFFYKELKNSAYVRLVGVIDKNPGETIVDGVKVKKIDDLKRMEYDAVLISSLNIEEAREIKAILIEMGVVGNKIYWAGELYYKEGFYNDFYFKLLDCLKWGNDIC